MAGIVSYGGYVPKLRIKSNVIAHVWGEDPVRIEEGLGIKEKAVANFDEDTATIAVEAARIALERVDIEAREIGAIYVGSESHPYAVKPTATIDGEAIDAFPFSTAADWEFACKAGTAAMQAVFGMVKAGNIKYGLAIGADTAQSKPGDALEYSAASGGAAFLIGNENVIAEILYTCSYTTDTPDFWRRAHALYPSHGGRFTGEPGYFRHVYECTKKALDETGYKISDFSHVIFHQPNAKFPLSIAKKLGVDKKQMSHSLLVPYIGNTYSGASMLALANVLDNAKAGELILLTSFGSGAGSDSFIFEVKDKIKEVQNRSIKLEYFIKNKQYIDYATYVKVRGKLKT
ncbi:MAG: hydroxymethylglutaryl-CoA synthase [Candidatus Anstonellales archaeon]